MNTILFNLYNFIYIKIVHSIKCMLRAYNSHPLLFLQIMFQVIQKIKGNYRKIAVNAIIPFCIFFCVTEAVGMNNNNEHSPSPVNERTPLLQSSHSVQRVGVNPRGEGCCARMKRRCGRCSEGMCTCAIIAAESAICGAASGVTSCIATKKLESELYWALKITCTQLPSPTYAGLVGCGAGCTLAAAVSATSIGCMKCYQTTCNHRTENTDGEQSSDSEDENETSSQIALRVITTQPSSIGTSNPAVITRQPDSRDTASSYYSGFLSEFNPKSHIRSLLGMQSALLDISEQTASALRQVVLKTHEHMLMSEMMYQQEGYVYSKGQKFQYPSCVAKVTDSLFLKRYVHHFVTFDSYETNFEHRLGSGQAGIVVDMISGVYLGLVYRRHNNHGEMYSGIPNNSWTEMIKVRTNTESLSTGLAFNIGRTGITGHLVSCYGWGKAKNIRSFMHGTMEVCSKGSPDIRIAGGLVQLGYNLSVSKQVRFTPYIETTCSVVQCGPYKESLSLFSCELTKNKEQVIEKSIGICSYWKPSDMLQAQLWIAAVSGYRDVKRLSCNIVNSRLKQEISVPLKQTRYKKTDVGLSYLINITPRFCLEMNGMMSFENIKKSKEKQLKLFFTYNY
ncbi:hypothetical protein BW722_06800 [Lawsonia intracellularis]|nr:hypothetical protein BW722_06800 [Lawsonia intracellularis]